MTHINRSLAFVYYLTICIALGQAQATKPTKLSKFAMPIEPIPAIKKIEKPIVQPKETKSEPNATSEKNEKSPQELLYSAIIAIKFDRTPDGILNAIDSLSKNNKPEKDKSMATTERIRLLANAGRWEELGQHINGLPYKESKNKAYSHLIRSILKPPTTIRSTQTKPTGVAPISVLTTTPRISINKPRPILTQEDFVELLKIAPTEISENDLSYLTGLFRSVGKPNLKTFTSQLHDGIGSFGGKDPVSRKKAVQLIEPLAIGDLAQHVLPLVDDNHGDWSLNIRAKLLEQIWISTPNLKNQKAVWEANEKLISNAQKIENKIMGVKRGFKISETLPKNITDNWMEKQFSQGGNGLKLLQIVQSDIQKYVRGANFKLRAENLKKLKQIVDVLLTQTDTNLVLWQLPLTIAGDAWLVEAENTVENFRQISTNTKYRYYDPLLEQQRILAQQKSTKNKPLAPAIILENAPSKSWFNLLPNSRKARTQSAIAGTLLKDKKILKALNEIEELAKLDSNQAKKLSTSLLTGWAATRNPNGSVKPRMPSLGMPVYYPSRPNGTPLTRARQKRNLQELSQILERLTKLPIQPPSAESIVTAFEGAHSFAEVYKLKDIKLVLGEPSKLPINSLAELSNSMRQRLATSWRAPQIQQQANTKRKEPQIRSEVIAGYETQLTLLEEGLKAHPDIWQLKLQQAAANFDLAEYQYGNKADLDIYVKHREAAFESFKEAAALYALQTAVTRDKPNALLFQLWFNSNLGASDLSYVTRQQTPDIGNLQQIREAILVLPDSEGHFKAFGESIDTNSRKLTPELKPRYLRSALVVLQNHSAGEKARELVQHYDDLLDEVELLTRIDGNDEIGHKESFGLFISLKHTSDIEREAGGFARYLVGGSKGSPYYPSYPGQRQSPRDDLEEHLNEKLGENFDIQSITFHDNKISSRTIGQPGWRETPLAYLLLKAKDASVDRIPELKIDLDFYDSLGPALLPVTSATQIVDARQEAAFLRPVGGLTLTQTLDARLANDNQELTLEIHATAKGLVPTVDKLVDLNIPGFFIAKNEDQGLSIARVESDTESVSAVSERTWLLTIKPEGKVNEPATFKYPKPTNLVSKSIFKQYSDADIKEVENEIAMAGIILNPQPFWPWIVGFAFLATIGIIGTRLSKKAKDTEVITIFDIPEVCTPFAVINLLQQIKINQPKKLAKTHLNQLNSTISKLEQIHFSPSFQSENDDIDLQGIAHEWVTRVN